MARGAQKIERLTSRRLALAESVRLTIEDEAQTYLPYVFGEPPVTEGAVRDFSRNQGDRAMAKRIQEGVDTTTIPMHGVHRAVMLPYLLANDPLWLNEDREGADAIERARGDLYARITAVAWEKGGTTQEVHRALDDAFIRRLGWMKTEFDPRIKLMRHRWIDARNILLDCETNSPRLADRRFIAEKMILPLETAKWFAKEIWDAPRYEFKPSAYDAMEQFGALSAAANGARQRQQSMNESPTEFVKIVLVHVAGANPYTTSAELHRKRDDDGAGVDDMYTGQDHILVMEACGGWDDNATYKFIGKMDWQYPCDPGEFPYTAFALTKDNRGVYPVSVMQASHPVQVALDADVQAYNTDCRNSAKRIVGIVPEAFQSEDQIDEATIMRKTLMCVNMKPGFDINQAIQVKELGAPPAHLTMAAMSMQDFFRTITGMQKFDVQVRANQTAYNTSVQNEAAQVKIEDLANMVIEGLIQLGRKGLMCARTMMRSDDVARWVNIPEVVDGKSVKSERLVKGGGTVTTNELWLDDPDWEDIRAEVDIDLEPQSIRFISPQQQAADLKELMDYQLQLFRVIGDTVGKNGVAAAKAIAQAANASLRQFCKLKNILNYERFLIDQNQILPPEPQPPSGDGLLQAASAQEQMMAQQQTEINAQQQGAITRLQNQGVDESAIPADMGGGM